MPKNSITLNNIDQDLIKKIKIVQACEGIKRKEELLTPIIEAEMDKKIKELVKEHPKIFSV